MADLASPNSQADSVHCQEESPKPLQTESPASTPPEKDDDAEEPLLPSPEGLGKSIAVQNGVYIFCPTQGLTPQQILILEAEVVRAATTQAQRNKELQSEGLDPLDARREDSDPLPTSSGSTHGWDQLQKRPQGAPPGKPEHAPRRRGRRGGVKQHLYQQMHAQQRSLRNASAMHQNLMPPHLEGLPQAALNPAGLLTGGTGVFLPAQQASRRRSLPVGGVPSAVPGGFLPGPQQLSYLQGSAPAFNSPGTPMLHSPSAMQPGASFGGQLDPAAGADYLGMPQNDQARLMASVSNSPGGNTELVTDALSRMLGSWTPMDIRMASDSVSSNNSADTIRQMSMEQARNSSMLTSSVERPHVLRQLSAQVPMDVSGFWANAANPGHPMDPPRQ